MNAWRAVVAFVKSHRKWDYGLPDAVVDSTDKALVDAVLTGRESIEEHLKRLGKPSPTTTGKHAATAEEGR